VWDWLNDNSGAMQAIASVASVAVTIVLVIITARYVRLTKGLAEAANDELRRQNEASKARRRELASQIKFLRDVLATLPNPANWSHEDSLMRNSTGWDNFWLEPDGLFGHRLPSDEDVERWLVFKDSAVPEPPPRDSSAPPSSCFTPFPLPGDPLA
jgi:hypothetical protein